MADERDGLHRLVAARYRERLLTGLANRWILFRGHRASFGERMLIVGAGELGELTLWMLQRSTFRDLFAVIGIVDDDPGNAILRS